MDMKNEIQKQFENSRNLKDIIQEKENELQRRKVEIDLKFALTELLQKDVDELKSSIVKIRGERNTAEQSARIA